MSEVKHNGLCKNFEEFFIGKGFVVQKEIELPNGKGAADLGVYSGDGTLRTVVEIKGQPTSPRQKKVARQFQRYQGHFGQEPQYLLAFPDHSGNLTLTDITTQQRYDLTKWRLEKV